MYRKIRIGTKTALALGVSTVAMMSAETAAAQESQVDLSVSAQASYDDNRYVSTTNKQSLYVFRISPTARFTLENEGSQTVFTARGSYSKSDDETIEADRFTYGASIESSHQFEYSTFSIGGGYDHEAILDTEFEDTGAFLNNATRDRGYASIGYDTAISENVSLRLSNQFQLLDYSTLTFNNYWSNSAGVGLDIAINDKTSLVQNVGYLHYEPENNLGVSLDSFSYLAGFSRDLSENTTLTLTGGATLINDVFRWSAVAELGYEMEDNQFSLRAAREITPTGLGGLRQTESVSAGTTYTASQSTRMGFEASWRRSKGLNNIVTVDGEFVGISPWVSFEVFRNVSVRFAYQLRRQRLSLSNAWGTSNSFFISLEV